MKINAENTETRKRLDALLMEAGKLIRDNPDLGISAITITDKGVHTLHNVPGVSRLAEED